MSFSKFEVATIMASLFLFFSVGTVSAEVQGGQSSASNKSTGGSQTGDSDAKKDDSVDSGSDSDKGNTTDKALSSEDAEDDASDETAIEGEKAGQTSEGKSAPVTAPALIKGIYVTSNRDLILGVGRPDLVGIQVEELIVPFCAENFFAYFCPFLKQEITHDTLKALRKALVEYLHDSGYTYNFHIEFKIKNEVIQTFITEKRIGKINYTGTEWMSERQIAQIFDVHEGDPIDVEKIQNNFAWLNQNSFHKSTIKFTPSKENKGDINIDVKTKDRFPLRFTLSGANTGTTAIGKENFDAGVTWGNAFWNNDLLSYDFAMSNIPKRYYSHTGNYMTYLPWKHRLSIFGTYTKSIPVVTHAHNVARSNQARVRYMIPFKPLYTRFLHSLTLGFDLKHKHSTSINIPKDDGHENAKPPKAKTKKQQVSQLVANYSLTYVTKEHNLSLNSNLYWSPGEILQDQTNTIFEAQRNGSHVEYLYLNVVFTDIYSLPAKFSLAGSLTFQQANATLPGTELINFGGYNTVRGYHPSEFTADNGIITNLELRTPTFSPLKHYFKKFDDSLFFLCFFDYGEGYNYHHTIKPHKKKHTKSHIADNEEGHKTEKLDCLQQYLMSIGAGFRYQVQQYVSLRCDYGYKLHHLAYANKNEKYTRRGIGQLHVGLLMSY